MSLPNEMRRHLPSVNALLSTPPIVSALKEFPRWAVVQEARAVVEDIREEVIALVTDQEALPQWHLELGEIIVARAKKAAAYSLRRVINATGVVLHTNLGRALLSEQALEHLCGAARHYSNLELDLATGERGSRYDHVRDLICELSGAEDAIVVNNNAAAVVICLSELAQGHEVILARGELVEIGGSFRIPEIMELSGCKLHEIGTTNCVHLRDYEEAVNEDTKLLLKVHTSNYKVIGFTKTVTVPELSSLAKEQELPIMHDLGSGSLVDLRRFGLPHEPTVREALNEGADLVTFSGDKLLGGPQIGVIAGRASLIKRLQRHPMLRAMRVDKLTLAALEATLRVYLDTKDPADSIPSLRMLNLKYAQLDERAQAFAASLSSATPESVTLRLLDGTSVVGAGSAPEAGLPTRLVAIRPANVEAAAIDAALRARAPAVMIRVFEGEVLVDLRTVSPEEEPALLAALASALAC